MYKSFIDNYEYNIETDHKSVRSHVMLQWQTEPPIVEGWYWVKWTERHKPIQIVYLQKDNKFESVLVIGNIHSHEVNSFAHWLGPLPIPELPKI